MLKKVQLKPSKTVDKSSLAYWKSKRSEENNNTNNITYENKIVIDEVRFSKGMRSTITNEECEKSVVIEKEVSPMKKGECGPSASVGLQQGSANSRNVSSMNNPAGKTFTDIPSSHIKDNKQSVNRQSSEAELLDFLHENNRDKFINTHASMNSVASSTVSSKSSPTVSSISSTHRVNKSHDIFKSKTNKLYAVRLDSFEAVSVENFDKSECLVEDNCLQLDFDDDTLNSRIRFPIEMEKDMSVGKRSQAVQTAPEHSITSFSTPNLFCKSTCNISQRKYNCDYNSTENIYANNAEQIDRYHYSTDGSLTHYRASDEGFYSNIADEEEQMYANNIENYENSYDLASLAGFICDANLIDEAYGEVLAKLTNAYNKMRIENNVNLSETNSQDDAAAYEIINMLLNEGYKIDSESQNENHMAPANFANNDQSDVQQNVFQNINAISSDDFYQASFNYCDDI